MMTYSYELTHGISQMICECHLHEQGIADSNMSIVERDWETVRQADCKSGGVRPKFLKDNKNLNCLDGNRTEDSISFKKRNFESKNENELNKHPWCPQPLDLSKCNAITLNGNSFITENSNVESTLKILHSPCENECTSSHSRETNTCNERSILCSGKTRSKPLTKSFSPEMDFLEIDFDPTLTNISCGWQAGMEIAQIGMPSNREARGKNGNIIKVCEQIPLFHNSDMFEKNNNENLPHMWDKSALHKCKACRTFDCFAHHHFPKSNPPNNSEMQRADHFKEQASSGGFGTVCHKSYSSRGSYHSNLILKQNQLQPVKDNGSTDCVYAYKSRLPDISPRKRDEGARTNIQCNCDTTVDTISFGSDVNHATVLKRPTQVELVCKLSGCAKQAEKIMIWSELCAPSRQYEQIGKSACGPTALLNVMDALNFKVSLKTINTVIKAKQRKEMAPLVEYLFSRSTAGTDHTDLIMAADLASGGQVIGKFFHMYPKRIVDLIAWLGEWIQKGAIPVLTLNLQRGGQPDAPIADAWHHQMVHGVGPSGIYLTNPLECVTESVLEDQLCSPSELLVRRADVVGRWREDCNLRGLIQGISSPWTKLNVLGQVVSMLREAYCLRGPDAEQSELQASHRKSFTSHIKIPAVYKSGVTLFMSHDNPYLNFLSHLEEFPFYNS